MNEDRKKRHGPLPLPEGERRTHCISTWLNDAELNQLNNQRGDLAKGEYLRCAALDVLPKTIVIPPLNLEAWTALSKASSNLNQLAKSQNIDTNGESWESIMATLKEFRSALIGAKLS